MNRPRKFDEEVLAYEQALYAFALKLTRNQAQAEDLMQDTLLKAFTHWDKYTPDTKMRAWLFTIAKNLWLSNRRKHSVTTMVDIEEDDFSAIDLIKIDANQFDRLALQDALHQIDQLSPALREVYIDITVNGQTYEETAQQYNVAVGTIKSRVFRALEELNDMGKASDAFCERRMKRDKERA